MSIILNRVPIPKGLVQYTLISLEALQNLEKAIADGLLIHWEALQTRTNVNSSMADIIDELFKFIYPNDGNPEKRNKLYADIWKKIYLPSRGKDDDKLQYVKDFLKINTDPLGRHAASSERQPTTTEQGVQYYQNQVEEKQKDIAKLNNQLEKINSQNEELKNKNQWNSNKLLSLWRDIDDLKEKKETTENKNRKLKNKNTKLENENDELKNKNTKLDELKNENDELKNKNTELENKNTELENKLQRFKAKYVALKEQNKYPTQPSVDI